MDEKSAPVGGETTLRYLKWLVTGLTVTMILGFLTIVSLFVMRFNDLNRANIPDEIVLPDGARAAAFTQGKGWYAIVTEDDEILIFSRLTGTLRQRVRIEPE
jgi:hypothetical protein